MSLASLDIFIHDIMSCHSTSATTYNNLQWFWLHVEQLEEAHRDHGPEVCPTQVALCMSYRSHLNQNKSYV